MKKGLGRGLGALIQTPMLEDYKEALLEIDINLIEPNPNQPRKNFPKVELEELASSVKEYGIIQPIIVNESENEKGSYYTIIAGERRYRAARIAKLNKIPCIIKSYSQMEALQIALIENIQRQDLNPIEEAICYKQLEEYFFHNREEISKKVGKSRNTISNRISLLSLDDRVQEMIINGQVPAGHAQKLVGLPKELQNEISQKILTQNLSIKETELLANKAPVREKNNIKFIKFYPQIETNLNEIFGTKVNIKDNGNKGKIEIEYYSKEDLERLLELLTSNKS